MRRILSLRFSLKKNPDYRIQMLRTALAETNWEESQYKFQWAIDLMEAVQLFPLLGAVINEVMDEGI